MFKTKHQFSTLSDDRAYLEEFMDAYGIPYCTEQIADKIRFTSEMTKREFNALCEYLIDLQKLGVYPISL